MNDDHPDHKSVNHALAKVRDENELEDDGVIKIVSKEPTLADITELANKAAEAKDKPKPEPEPEPKSEPKSEKPKKEAPVEADDGSVAINVRITKKEPPKEPEPAAAHISQHKQRAVLTVVGDSKAAVEDHLKTHKPAEPSEETHVVPVRKDVAPAASKLPDEEKDHNQDHISEAVTVHGKATIDPSSKMPPPPEANGANEDVAFTPAPISTPPASPSSDKSSIQAKPKQQNPKVFDTRAYHLPIKHGHRRGGGAMTLLLVLIILVALGVAGYFAIKAEVINVPFNL